MAVSKTPSVKPAKPYKPPSDRQGQGKRISGEDAQYGAKHEFGGYDHDGSMSPQHYGHNMKAKHVGSGEHKSEFPGIGGSMPKAGHKSGD